MAIDLEPVGEALRWLNIHPYFPVSTKPGARSKSSPYIETCILSYVKRITSPGSMHETGCSGLVHWDDLEGWDGDRGGRGVQDGEHMYTRDGFMSIYENHYNIIK